MIEAWVDRTIALSALPGVEQVFCFENRGEEIGVTLATRTARSTRYPFVTPRTRQMLESARAPSRAHRAQPVRRRAGGRAAPTGSRVVARGDHWTAFVPAAARWPMEVHLYPNRQVADLPALTDDERDEFATIYLDLLRRLDALYDSPMPYVAGWHQAPVNADRDLA